MKMENIKIIESQEQVSRTDDQIKEKLHFFTVFAKVCMRLCQKNRKQF